MKTKRKRPSIVLRGGKPAEVILDIEQYREMLERIEDLEDLEYLDKIRKKPLQFRDFQASYAESAVLVLSESPLPLGEG